MVFRYSGLRHAPIICDVISPTDCLIVGIPGLDQALCHIPHVHHGHNIVAGAKNQSFTGLNKIDEAAKAGAVSWPIYPCRTYNNDWRAVFFHKPEDQFLTSNFVRL